MEIIVIIILLFYLLFMLRLRDRVKSLENLISSHQSQLSMTQTPENQTVAAPRYTLQQSEVILQNERDLQYKNNADRLFITWLKRDWLLKLGAFLLLVGFGWFVTYAFLNNWIGPIGRITFGIIIGLIIMVLGWWRIQKYLNQGSVFVALGSTIILLTMYAAREVYGFFTPVSALAIMFLSVVFASFISIRYKARPLALTVLALAGITPLLTVSPSPDYINLFLYLLVVTAGTIWIVIITGWRQLTAIALIIISLYSLAYFSENAENFILLLLAHLFAIIFFITNTSAILNLKDKNITPDIITAGGTGLFILVWIINELSKEWQSLVISLWMMIFAITAFIIFKITQRKEPFYVYAGVALGMLAAATSAELQGTTLSIAYTIESIIIPIIAYLTLKDIKVAERLTLLLIGPIFFSFGHLATFTSARNIFNQDFFALFILIAGMIFLGLFFRRQFQNNTSNFHSTTDTVLLITGSIYAYILLWFSLQIAFPEDTAIAMSLVIYTIAGLISYSYGRVNDRQVIRRYGSIILALVVARLLLVDVWGMELGSRIITFFIIGILLISTAFLGRKNKTVITQ